MHQIPESLRVHVNSELQYIQSCNNGMADGKSMRNFDPNPVIKTSKKGKTRTYLRKHYPILGFLSQPSASCALGVPPVLLPKLSFPRGRNHHRKSMNTIDFTSHVRNFMLQEEVDEKMLFDFKFNINPVSPEDQYDFFTSEIRKVDGELMAFGDIPRSKGKRGAHPMRLPHLWMELFRRGFSFERPGPQGIDGPWIVYDLEHIRFFYYFFLFVYEFCLGF